MLPVKIRIAFQGEAGAFSEDAAYHFWNNSITPVPQKTFRDVFENVLSEACAFGIIPIENSLTGSVHQNVDLFLEFELSIIGEIVLRIQHHLLARQSVKLEDVRRIYSHPQALLQCSDFLEKMKHIEVVPMYDTAGSAKYVFEYNEKGSAAIASLRAGQVYHLHALKKNIENNHQNFTRFLVISKTSQIPRKGGKTSIVFSMKDVPGALFKAMGVFARRGINLFKIESRPIRKGPWKYWFYLDFEGSLNQPACQNALHRLGEITTFLKVLGSYPKGKVVG